MAHAKQTPPRPAAMARRRAKSGTAARPRYQTVEDECTPCAFCGKTSRAALRKRENEKEVSAQAAEMAQHSGTLFCRHAHTVDRQRCRRHDSYCRQMSMLDTEIAAA